ncbi:MULTISPECIES: aminotransferase class IV [unclassified Flavobacterium]|uniref:aminotransferase class IV n=1 Tax=unclassified Flavobacterium TaxID=196869 RepID=UPI001F12D393|nr:MULTISPECIES: aminotransferase class IV [unclassified Flavobacterium]UMY65781.1 aminotransferase class IV [Flavobacterium sp. HJ-32-4]
MLHFNGELVPDASIPLARNRGFLFGDGVFETLRVNDAKPLFLEDHYFRLMAAMRICRMEIPMTFTMEFFSAAIAELVTTLGYQAAARVRITVFRNSGGFYRPTDNTVSWLMEATAIDPVFGWEEGPYEVELYKDYLIPRQLLSSIKSTNRMLNVTAAVFAEENGYANCLLLNDARNVAEAVQGNVFMLTGNRLATPPVSEGCLNGVMRQQVMALARKMEGIEVVEEPISPFDLQKADELFLTNVIMGIRPITSYRKKAFGDAFARRLLVQLNAQLRLA